MTHIRHRLAIDGGQTGIRLRLTEEAAGEAGGPARSRVLAELDEPGVLTDRSVVDQVAERVVAFAASAAVHIDEVAVGLSGLTPAGAKPDDLLRHTRAVGVDGVALAHDSVTGYLAANGTEAGVVLAIGTGSVTLAASDTRTAKVDGWGYLLGDAGSGFWLGRAGLDAVMRAYDGRGPATALSTPAVDVFGPEDEMYMRLQGDTRRVSLVASFARTVVEAAAAGDAVALAITQGAAEELAVSGTSALSRTGWMPGSPARASWVGSLLTHSAVLRAHVDEYLAARTGGLTLEHPFGGPLDGVSTLLDVAGSHPLHALIHTANIGTADPVR
ncbi:N-acetylglucosamine kinase [Okibacterium fritillariae]|uniref:BadF-type ATPase n=1 Tax=Okibacterium fritillariae TaxID=123320 RepID=A0A1T5IP02_9MICO|nr:BadF/BadG/BcrA/BcrD ATPase family protein [Okibacterium fritillariae]SKC40906.1 BadF-type ATPase [Okibacterium fritillariae]